MAELYSLLGEFCHKYRNRLNNLKLGLYLARQGCKDRNSGWGEAQALYAELEATIERLQGVCRPITLDPIRTDLAAFLDDRVSAWTGSGLRLDCRPTWTPAFGHFDPSRLGSALDGWAASRARSGAGVRLNFEATRDLFKLDWLERGESRPIDPSDLSLPLLVRVIAAHGGAAHISTDGGVRVVLTWPSGNAAAADRSERRVEAEALPCPARSR